MHAVDSHKSLLPTKHKKGHKIALNDRKVKFIETVETLKVFKEQVGHIACMNIWTCDIT